MARSRSIRPAATLRRISVWTLTGDDREEDVQPVLAGLPGREEGAVDAEAVGCGFVAFLGDAGDQPGRRDPDQTGLFQEIYVVVELRLRGRQDSREVFDREGAGRCPQRLDNAEAERLRQQVQGLQIVDHPD